MRYNTFMNIEVSVICCMSLFVIICMLEIKFDIVNIHTYTAVQFSTGCRIIIYLIS